MLTINPESPTVLTIIGYACVIFGVLFTLAIMFEGVSTKRKKKHNIFDETDIY
jgi:hypothetical protein